MKNKVLLLLPILAFSATHLTSCGDEDRVRITYGTVMHQEMISLSYSDFKNKMTNGENMIVATYDSEYSLDCGCWRTFSAINNIYVKQKGTVIYKLDRKEITKNDYGLTIIDGSNPTCVVTNNGEVKYEYVYNPKSANIKMFEVYESFVSQMDNVTKEPQIILADIDFVQKAIFKENRKDFIVYHSRNKCPDCSYCTPMFLEPYCANNNLAKKVYMVDIQDIYDDKTLYQGYKDKLQMNAEVNEIFGYQTGVVPTFQIWNNGVLKDACVYFNDEVDRESWTITNSYYTPERVKNLKYTDTVLLGREIPDEEIGVCYWGTYEYDCWTQEAQAKIHNPILKSFLDYYAK